MMNKKRTLIVPAAKTIKPTKCIACNGSGYYDYSRNGNTPPKCAACEGSGING